MKTIPAVQNNSFTDLFKLLRYLTDDLFTYNKGLTTNEFERLCTNDEVFRNNILLHTKDITMASMRLITALTNKR